MLTVSSGAEVLFRVGDIERRGDEVVGRMPLGPWSVDEDGRTALGAFAVLADDVLGYAIIDDPARPADHWSVSVEITVDAVGELPMDGMVEAAAVVRSADEVGAVATGELRDGDGRVVAVISERGRWVALSGIRDPLGEQATFVAPAAASVAELIGMRAADDGATLEVTEILRNPAGSLHGGVSMAAAGVAARRALEDGGPALRVRGIRTAFPRPTLVGEIVTVTPTVLARGRTSAVVDVVTSAEGRPRTLSRITAEG